MSNASAIAALEKRLADLERKANALIEVLNDLRAEDGLPPRDPYSDRPSPSISSSDTISLNQIKGDTFYGKKLQTAIRQYLEMRKSAGMSAPATPREIYDAIKSGGYQFDAKDDNVALIGLRALLRKRTAFFHKLPTGAYGLTSWYPDAKKQRNSGEDTPEEKEDAPTNELVKRKRGRPPKMKEDIETKATPDESDAA